MLHHSPTHSSARAAGHSLKADFLGCITLVTSLVTTEKQVTGKRSDLPPRRLHLERLDDGRGIDTSGFPNQTLDLVTSVKPVEPTQRHEIDANW